MVSALGGGYSRFLTSFGDGAWKGCFSVADAHRYDSSLWWGRGMKAEHTCLLNEGDIASKNTSNRSASDFGKQINDQKLLDILGDKIYLDMQ